MAEEFTLERICLLDTVTLPAPDYNKASPLELKITTFQLAFAQKSH